ncbi:MAG: NAD(P)/FAD-dependent oxidoreductase [Nitrospirae bacterium]|nr:NAD(P)/FAD-dependent oxidoreductase [Nitrospirota bacterium]
MDSQFDITIVGGGAAGLAAGIFAAQTNPQLKIGIVDAARSIGAKILVSGGGRCNVTNEHVSPNDFHAPKQIVRRILKRLGQQDTVQWFESLGVPLKIETTGKLFPESNSARTVLQALLQQCRSLGIAILTQHRVQSISPSTTSFKITHQSGSFVTHSLIMATGGQSLPKTGSDGHGWEIAKKLGHTCTPCYPALVPLVLKDNFFHKELSGISHEATLMTRVNGKLIDRRSGSLLWTHFGMSGPVVMDASRFWVLATGQGDHPELSLSFFPGHSLETIDQKLIQAKNKTLLGLLSGAFPQRLVKILCFHLDTTIGQHQHDDPQSSRTSIPLSQLPRRTRRDLAHLLTNLPLPVLQSRGWNFAEVTAGGIPLEEINPQTMESRKNPGLYLIGEILDCDGRIGGFNFQWAWSTGYIAGNSAAASFSTKTRKIHTAKKG